MKFDSFWVGVFVSLSMSCSTIYSTTGSLDYFAINTGRYLSFWMKPVFSFLNTLNRGLFNALNFLTCAVGMIEYVS